MDSECKVIGSQLKPERNVSNHKDSSDGDDAMERALESSKDYDPGICCKCRKCSKMKTFRQCICCKQVQPVNDFILHGIFVLNQAKNIPE